MTILNHYRENRSINFFLKLRDLQSTQNRNIEAIIAQIIRKINLHSRSTSLFDTNVYMLQLRNNHDYALYLQCPHPKAVGFNRQYFKHNKAYGARLLNLMKLDVKDQAHGTAANAKFDAAVVDDAWIPVNDVTKKYYDENVTKIEKNQSLLKDLDDLEFQEKATMQDLYFDFATRYENGDVESSDKYFVLLKEAGAKSLWLKALQRREEFEKMSEHLDDFFQSQQENPDIREDLAKYVNELPH